MPDLGRLTRDRLPHALPATAPLYPPPPWPPPGAPTPKGGFQTDAETAVEWVAPRAGMFMGAVALQGVADSARAVVALRELWGFPATLGTVRLRAGPRSARARLAAGGQALADLRLSGGEPCDPSLIRFDPVLNIRLISSIQPGKRHALLKMVQLDPDYTI